ncbi:uncharacterized protein CYBJADRAFT_166824 [Cyberlindnera jadinii NRRL Y-1542]|uniref:Uncharacterized protein n=1 Tax=Cyberlindnera jadinii (strain ATCC 18201 / CBS 1600 / BCRC 20928 / JCM 3617 / NBRC 0987 / NRRL Y-1542) TaxID=983966 RepID=A0A1E4S6C5_CYBJN|nr:hypothetical protein CYBJADRAFT_166824 [Cyberlindnera jadinii NRRL Y-1542]ODV75066.1 hypothetical protein CYBJADRAFT_166824 [Cyberlindnera jadinii NRRL Y-1542]
MKGFFCQIHEKNKVNSTYNLIINTQDCARGLQLCNSVTPKFDIMSSKHCEVSYAEM